MLCMSISAPFWIHGKAIREAVCNQLAELRRKAHFEFSVNAHYIFSGESEDFCEAEITAFKTALSPTFRFQLYLSHHRTLSSTAYASKIKALGVCHRVCHFCMSQAVCPVTTRDKVTCTYFFKTAGSESERERHFGTFKKPRRAQSFSTNRLRFSEKLLSALLRRWA